jgi:FkbM family methyltransferase
MQLVNDILAVLTHLPATRPTRRLVRFLTRFAETDRPMRALSGVRLQFTGHWLQRLAVADSYEPETLIALRRYATDTVIDIGAHEGLVSLWLAQTARIVLACEPNPANVTRLRANAALNPQLRILVVAAAMGATNGEVTFHVIEDGAANGSVLAFAYAVVAERIQVPMRTIDSLEHDGRVSLLKIDTEGYELEVLRGAQQLLARDRPVICFEVSLTYWAEQVGSVRELLSFLTDRDYTLWQVQEGGILTPFRWLNRRVDNLFALPNRLTPEAPRVDLPPATRHQ